MLSPTTISPTQRTSEDHYLIALSDPWFVTLVEIQSVISCATFQFFSGKGLKNLHLPITTSSISSPLGLGSDSLPVKIDLFGVPTYLADSMQFMLEYGCRLHSGGSFYLMPSFRGESADETHLCQFYHSEAEIIGPMEEMMILVEEYLRYMSNEILMQSGAAIQAITADLSHIEALAYSQGPLPRLTMNQAAMLLDHNPEYIKWCEPGFRLLTRKGERKLISDFGGFVWITDPDHMSVPFYQAFAGPDGKSAKAADLLFGLGEIVGSGERHRTAQDTLAALKMHQVNPETYYWYIRMREQFPMQTSGFGLGVERYICWLLKHNDVRDCQLLPRYNGIVNIP